MKPRIFLGSSGENLSLLEKVQALLSADFDCLLWTNAFAKNKSNLDSLIHQTKMSDFSILLAMPDDLVVERKETYNVSRDNVIFEFGLFLGSGGLSNSFLLAEQTTDLPSDLDGITIYKFTTEDGKYNSLDAICADLKKQIDKSIKSSNLGLLPSTALAIGFYYSFIKKVCEDLHETGRIKAVIDSQEREVTVEKFTFNVIVPDDLDDNGVEDFRILYNKKHNLMNAMTGAVSSGKRGYPFVFKIDPPDQDVNKNVEIHLFDIPSTLDTIVQTIKLFFPTDRVGFDEEIERLEKRELANFAKTLRFLISKNAATRENVKVHERVTLN